MVLGPLIATFGFLCLVAFIVIIAHPPHEFSEAAKGLLAAGVLLYFGAALLGFLWMSAILPKMYSMWLTSFEPGWTGDAADGEEGWWSRYVRFERALGRWEHKVYQGAVRCGRAVKGMCKGKKRGKLRDEDEVEAMAMTER